VSPLRLAIVLRRFWPLAGSEQSVLGNLAAELAAQGCAVRIITARWHPSWPAEIRWRNCMVTRLPPPGGHAAPRAWLRAVQRYLRAHAAEFDLVYVAALRDDAAAVVDAVGRRLPVVLRAQTAGRQGDCVWQIEARDGRRIKERCQRAAALVATTPLVRRELEAAGYPRKRIVQVLDGVPAAPPNAVGRQTARGILADCHTMLQLMPQSPLVICLGRVAADRGLETLLDAWAMVVGQRPDARLWLVGDTSHCEPLRERIARLGLFGRAVVAGMFDDCAEILAAADVLAAPAPRGAELAVREALAAGLPVVAADVPAHRWLLADGADGLLVRSADANAWAATLLRLLNEPEFTARPSAAGSDCETSRFSLAKMVDAHLTLFRELVGGEGI
jgi:glycosyltransferase involved in cell wall biosynthesis